MSGRALLGRRAPTPCRHLRSKAPADGFEGLDPEAEAAQSNASHWCLATMDAVGPDDQVVHALDCRAGRLCFAAPDGPAHPGQG